MQEKASASLDPIDIFSPQYNLRKKKVESERLSFVHYTTAQAAMNILETEEFWLRKTTRMNDYSEIEHGFECLRDAYRNEMQNLESIFNPIFPNLVLEVQNLFNQWWERIRYNIYVGCFSEFDYKEEDALLGKLSMWRAYGGSAGVAIVMNSEPFFNESDAFESFTAPVIYADSLKFKKLFDEIIENIRFNIGFLKTLGREQVSAWLHHTFLTLSVSVKHPGFKEENEWRVIYPKMRESKYLKQEVKVINGIPQNIYKIPLKNIPEKNLYGIDINSLVQKVIIGPSDNASDIIEAFRIRFQEAGIDPNTKLAFSNIPLRN